MQSMAMNGPMNPGMMGMPGPNSSDMLIPGNKVGLIIGKGGETIKSMQERSQCKIVFTQDISVPSDQEKNLRISGEPNKVEMAKKMVTDLLFADRGMAGPGMQNQFGGQRHVIDTIAVPRSLVGMVIGKGGDMIRKIQDDHGVRLQFDQDNKISPERCCTVTGPPERVREAVTSVNTLMANDRNRQQGFNNFNGAGPSMGQANGPGGDSRNETSFPVPVDKCGLVIGKNGVTIGEIKLNSGAHVEIQRNQPENAPHKHFLIRGDPAQTQKAIDLISAKIGAGPEGMPSQPFGGAGQYSNPAGPPQQQGTYSQGWGDASAYPTYAAPYSQQTAPVAADPSAAAVSTPDWNSYYASQQQQPQQFWSQATQQVAGAGQTQLQAQDATGQPNYAQLWYEYYMALGLYDHANMMLQAAQQGEGAPTAPR